MTRLFNLESYSELCSYAHLYNREVEEFLSNTAYKDFLDKNSKQGYLADYSDLTELSFSSEMISIQNIGINLDFNNKKLYIVSDKLDLLTLEALLNPGEIYLYKSAYHYWNYLEQIKSNLNLNKPVIFIDLNSLNDPVSCPLQFKHPQNSLNPVPIIDNRKGIIQELTLDFKLRENYNNIYDAISQEIIKDNFSELEANTKTLKHLSSYLQKINIFERMQEHIVIEILHEDKIYYKLVNLNTTTIEDIVLNRINWQEIQQFVCDRQEYQFVLISEYNNLPRFRTNLIASNLFLPDRRFSQFKYIWHDKQQKKFPLFGQYLDQIEFQIQKAGEIQWIQVLSEQEQDDIYYEGQTEIKPFVGRIPETGKDSFTLPHPSATLPIRVNGKDYCINGVSQDYIIINPLDPSQAETEKLKIRIEFILKPGFPPQLIVRDLENKYKIETKLANRSKKTYNYIPWQEILSKRKKDSEYIPNKQTCLNIIKALSELQQEKYYSTYNNEQLDAEQIGRIKNYINRAYENIHRSRNNLDLLFNVNPEHPSLKELRATLREKYLLQLIKIAFKYLESNFPQNNNVLKIAMDRFVIFLGKTYKFSNELPLQNFFEEDRIKLGTEKIKSHGEYFKFLSRVAIKKEFQIAYFQCFYKSFSNKKPSYQIDGYLWGYGRILLWYSNFQYTRSEFDYPSHFYTILTYLLNNPKLQQERSKESRKNIFLSLIYLLTFRESDKTFCVSDSEEFKLAEKVGKIYKHCPVYLKINPNKSLNDYFDELLHSQSSQKDLNNMIQAD